MAAVESEIRVADGLLPMADGSASEGNLDLLYRLYPATLGAIFIVTALICSVRSSGTAEDVVAPTVRGPGGKPLPMTKRKKKHGHSRKLNMTDLAEIGPGPRLAFRVLAIILTMTLFINATVIGLHLWQANPDLLVRNSKMIWWCSEPMVVYVIGTASVYLYLAVSLFDWKHSPGTAHILTWSVAFVAEGIMFMCNFLNATGYKTLRHLTTGQISGRLDSWEQIDLVLSLIRVATLLGLCSLYVCLWSRGRRHDPPSKEEGFIRQTTTRHPLQRMESSDSASSAAEESTPLLSATGRSYSTHDASAIHERSLSNSSIMANCAETSASLYKDEQAAFYRPEKMPDRNWWEYLRGYALFSPYLWPRGSTELQVRIFICVVLLIAQRVVNVLLPYQIGKVADRLAGTLSGQDLHLSSRAEDVPWFSLWLVNFLMLIQGQGGLLGSLRSIIWVKVSQYSYKALEMAAFQHVHSLSLDFHLGKRTGEVLSALNKGGAINTFLEQVTFQLMPMIVDLLLAIYFFYRVFNPTYAAIVSVNTFWYLYLTVKMARTRADQRREMTNADREEEAVKNDSITSYETVKYFNAEQCEFRRFESAIDEFQKAEAKVSYGTNMMSVAQNAVYVTGLAVALTVCAIQVWMGLRTVGEFTTLLMYLQQMQQPLNFFSQFYRMIQQALISGERLLELFKIQPSVQDLPHAQDLTTCEGHIRFKGVKFAYGKNQEPAIGKLDFECAPGTTTAFVGESGGGKSTVFRLMFRYYNCSEGSIAVDGHDVKDLTIDSVRRYIGVVPQDTILFNETLMYNLKYARPGCTDEEVYEACKAASIHDKIMGFAKQYNTKVGERGLRLSGGEKQRVAIARTILKNPKIIMLDEATSALDSQTEQHIQRGVLNVGQGRTVLIIAHRLSTITHADQIIVLNQGEVVERGTHEELLSLNGYYTSMWQKQAQATAAANRASYKLLKEAAGHRQLEPQSGYTSMASSAILPHPSPTQGSKPGSPIYDDHLTDGESSGTLQSDTDHR
ncbi:related to vacuolar membrane protein HMT1 (heavy metal tolerance protein) [Cephalotrichum gorgonifer]|uniref:Related to vacuolar membrane protein HMT1 (Heavy metal tolerance protein) n=1 Tax=Cephalotrichum gorgonifer TaxID=2041049 RepID=A0AAE8SWG0_9PEZI|nr:related to vacuolar membrane protein HMT1 (heavy metal tolerance protein) [Cephalotrichum gorgonifer]